MDVFWAAPPISRTITAATVVGSCLIRAGLVNAHTIIFFWPWVFKKIPPQLWRLESCFWITGPKLQLIFDPYFLFIYGSQLERDSPRFKSTADFFIYIVFVKAIILALAGGYLRGTNFLQALMLAFAYTYAQDNPTRRVSMFIVTFEAKYLPLASLFIGFLITGPQGAMEQATGLIGAHLYDFLTRIWPTFGGGRNLLPTPHWLKGWFGDNNAPRVKSYGTAFGARGPGAASPSGPSVSSATSSGSSWGNPLGSWSRRGQGRRLGGD